jgi:steroid delta-isomerase-like uncharacterized protein
MTPGDEGIDSNMQLIHRFTEECWNDGNLERVPELIAEDCRFHDPVFPHLAPGPAGLQRHIERVRRAFPDLKFTILEATREKNTVTAHWRASATQTAQFLGIPATQRFASITGTSIYRIVGGKIVESWVKWDVMSLMAQLGRSAVGREAKQWGRAG